MNDNHTDFDELAANAEAMLAAGPIRLEAHWSDDPRFDSEEHFDRVQAGFESIDAPDATASDLCKDAEFRSLRESDEGNYGEAISWANIGRDGRHGRGHEL